MKRYFAFILIVFFMISLSSCRLFRGKNKCNTCPSWKAEIQKVSHEEQLEQVNV